MRYSNLNQGIFMKYNKVIKCFALIWSFVNLFLITTSICGCSDIHYLSQATAGHLRMMSARVPIENVLKANDLDPESRSKLKMVLEVRSYASEKLGLPKNKSYTFYSETNRRYLGWNVYVAPQFFIEAMKWCFPVAGCVAYRGYFSKKEAIEFARKMKERNFDVFVTPFEGYSTLGWYDDPVLSTQLQLNQIDLAGLVIHELAHQKFYVPGDSRFNEAFAVTVQRAGTLQWLKFRNRDDLISEDQQMWVEEDGKIVTILKVRQEVIDLYRSGLDSRAMEEKKTLIFANLKSKLNFNDAESPKSNAETNELNNAYIASIDTYYLLLPAFQSILDGVGGNLPQFYKKVEYIGKLPFEKRQYQIELLQRKYKEASST
jgi:predicted aminopeptidase